MKGLIIKLKDTMFKAGIPNYGVSLIVNITRYDGAFWSVGGLRMPGEIHVTWNGGTLEVGDEIEVEFAEFDEATLPDTEESYTSSCRRKSQISVRSCIVICGRQSGTVEL